MQCGAGGCQLCRVRLAFFWTQLIVAPPPPPNGDAGGSKCRLPSQRVEAVLLGSLPAAIVMWPTIRYSARGAGAMLALEEALSAFCSFSVSRLAQLGLQLQQSIRFESCSAAAVLGSHQMARCWWHESLQRSEPSVLPLSRRPR